jgi:serine/threonine-protein kinase
MSVATTPLPSDVSERPAWQPWLERFDIAWRSGSPPQFDNFLNPACMEPWAANTADYRRLLAELVQIDLEYRWKSSPVTPPIATDTPPIGTTPRPALPLHPRLEDYVALLTELGPLDQLDVELIGEEYRVRHNWGDRPGHAEYLSRFAAQGERLRPVLQRIDAELAAEASLAAATPAHTLEEAAAAPGTRVGRYELREHLGRGTFGTVWRAWDTQLDRDVAVKLPRRERFADTGEEERFLREARATAQLHHPGIVAVHDVGRADDTVYLVTDLVPGRSLADWLTAHRPSFAQTAALAAQVAEALDYAHQRGVVHRDLKPSNIMLAPGELEASGPSPVAGQPVAAGGLAALPYQPRILDFGLAKREAGEITLTLEGQVLGTPVYMSPEQIRNPHTVDGRSDVYSLGVLLYQLLTGELPFRGVADMVLHQIQHDEPRPPRQLNDKVPRDLETITLQCLAKEPGRRYATAGALAADLRRWLKGEPIQARPVGRLERLVRWCRRKPLVAGLTAALVLVVVGGFAGVASQWWRAETHLAEVGRQRARAEESFHQAREAVAHFFTRVSDDPRLNRNGLQPLRKDLLEIALAYELDFLRQRGDDPTVRAEVAQAYGRLALIRRVIGSPADSLADFQRARAIWEELVTANPTDPSWRRDLARANDGIAFEHNAMNQPGLARDFYEQAQALQERLVAEHPENPDYRADLATTLHNRAMLAQDTGQRETARALLHRTIALRKELVQARPDLLANRNHLAGSYNNLGNLHWTAREYAAAQECYQEAIRLRAALVQASPDTPEYQDDLAASYNNLGSVHWDMGQLTEARPFFTEALNLRKALAEANPTVHQFQGNLALCYANLGNLQQKSGQFEEAVRSYQEARSLFARLVHARPEVGAYRLGQYRTLYNLGFLHVQANRHAEALPLLEEARTFLEGLGESQLVAYRKQLAGTYNALAKLHGETGKLEDALPYLEKALAIADDLAAQDPANPEHQRQRAMFHVNIGSNYTGQARRDKASREKLEMALASFRQAQAILAPVVQANPQDLECRRFLGRAAYGIGCRCWDLQRREEALAAYRTAVDHQGQVLAARQMLSDRQELSQSYFNLAYLLREVGRPAEAAAVTRARRQLWLTQGDELRRVAWELTQCIPLVNPAKAKDAAAADAERQGYADEAMAALHQAVQHGFTDGKELKEAADWAPLRSRADFQELVRDLEAKGKAPAK